MVLIGLVILLVVLILIIVRLFAAIWLHGEIKKQNVVG